MKKTLILLFAATVFVGCQSWRDDSDSEMMNEPAGAEVGETETFETEQPSSTGTETGAGAGTGASTNNATGETTTP